VCVCVRAWARVGQLRGMGPTEGVGARGVAKPNSALGRATCAQTFALSLTSEFVKGVSTGKLALRLYSKLA